MAFVGSAVLSTMPVDRSEVDLFFLFIQRMARSKCNFIFFTVFAVALRGIGFGGCFCLLFARFVSDSGELEGEKKPTPMQRLHACGLTVRACT